MPRPRLNPLVTALASPPIPEAQGWLRLYDGHAGPPVDLSQAVPGSPPPPELLGRLSALAGERETARYGPITGDADLRATYADWVGARYRGHVTQSDIAVTTGCNEAFVASALLVAQAGDNILLPTPWYFNHPMSLAMLGVEARALPATPERGFVPDAADAEALIDDRTRAIALVTPNNPTGAIYPPEILAAFADLCRRRGLWLILDETYRDFLPDAARPPHDLFGRESWRENLIQLYSFSKSFAIPGHRLGAVTADAEVIGVLAKILDNLQICAPRAGQGAVAWAIPALADWREGIRHDILARAEAFRTALAPFPEWRIESLGAYFAYLRHPFEDMPGTRVARALARDRGVLVLPGSYFGPGQEAFLRVAFANVPADSLAGLGERLAGFVPAP